MKLRLAPRAWSALLCCIAAAVPLNAASFSADLVETRGSQTATGTFNYQDKSYRFDTAEKDQRYVIQVDGATGALRVLAPAEKEYAEVKAGDPMSLYLDPFTAYAVFAKTKQVRTEGTESIGGVSCRKQVVFSGEQVFVTGWVCDGLEVPMKVQLQIDGHTLELRNVKPGPQDPALFLLPAGYHLRVEEPEPQPAWVSQVAAAPLLNPPFERKLAAEGLIRLHPRAGQWITIQGTNSGKELGTFSAVPLKGGKADVSSTTTVSIDAADTVTLTQSETPDRADEIVVRVVKGTITIKAAYVAPHATGPSAAPAAPAAEATPEPTASVTPPREENVAAHLAVAWTGPGNKDDYITVALPAHPAGRFVTRGFVRDGNPAPLWAPSDPGDYEVRYVLGRGAKILAREPITINPVTAAVTAPASAKAGTDFEVTWQGPGYSGDFIAIARAAQPAGASLASARVKAPGALKIRAPREAGTFEVRYILGRGPRVLAKTDIEITPP